MKKLESGGNGSGGKKNKYLKILNNFFKNLTNLSNHLEFLFKNKYIESRQDHGPRNLVKSRA